MLRIAIVGAGPAGASAGWHLASRGHAVTLIDKSEFPRPKTCGDWIPLAALRELDLMGLDRAALVRLSSEHAVIDATVLAAPDGRLARHRAREPAYVIPRHVFDAIVWRRAIDAGCQPMRRAVRTLLEDDGAFLTAYDVVVDARGALAGAPNAVALRAYWAVPRECLGSGDAHTVQIHADGSFRRGYGWIFPVHDDGTRVRFNVGVGLWGDDNVTGRTVADFYARFTTGNPVLAVWKDAASIERAVGCHVGLGRWTQAVSANGVLRIGDAANLADPLTGDGIANALKSGRLAAEAIEQSQNGADAAAAWQRAHDREYQPEFRSALTIRRLLSSTSGKNAASRLLSAVPSIGVRVQSAIFAERSYGSLAAFWT